MGYRQKKKSCGHHSTRNKPLQEPLITPQPVTVLGPQQRCEQAGVNIILLVPSSGNKRRAGRCGNKATPEDCYPSLETRNKRALFHDAKGSISQLD